MKNYIKKIFRTYCPNVAVLRKALNKMKLKDIDKYTMASEDVAAGERSEKEQMLIVEKYAKKWPSYTAELKRKYTEYVSRCAALQDRQDDAMLLSKVLFACFAYGFMPDEFFVYELEHKTAQERKTYISDRERFRYVYSLNDIIDIGILFDKYKAYSKFKKYYKRDAVGIERETDYPKFAEFANKHSVFVQKNVGLSRGNSVKLVDSESCGKSLRQLFEEMLAEGKYIVEERVMQSAPLSGLNPSSVNTIRCMTFQTSKGIVIGPCFLKVGQGGSFVDNGGKGGILIGIDSQTGVLVTSGYDEFLNEYAEHPDTKVKFMGYRLPDWEQMKALAIEVSAQIPSVKYIGWDFAHTDFGWVIIEGNGGGQFIGPQIVWKQGIKEEIETLMRDIDMIC